jgi:hypothetical protein
MLRPSTAAVSLSSVRGNGQPRETRCNTVWQIHIEYLFTLLGLPFAVRPRPRGRDMEMLRQEGRGKVKALRDVSVTEAVKPRR